MGNHPLLRSYFFFVDGWMVDGWTESFFSFFILDAYIGYSLCICIYPVAKMPSDKEMLLPPPSKSAILLRRRLHPPPQIAVW